MKKGDHIFSGKKIIIIYRKFKKGLKEKEERRMTRSSLVQEN